MPASCTACAITSAYDGVATSTCAPRSCEQHRLPRGHAARHRHDRRADPLRALVEAVAAGEEAVRVRVVHEHPGPDAGHRHAARHQLASTPRGRRRCSRRRSACRACRSTRGARTSDSTGTRSSPNGYASRSVAFSVNGSSASCSSDSSSTPKVARRRASWRARSSSRGSRSAASQISGLRGGAHVRSSAARGSARAQG